MVVSSIVTFVFGYVSVPLHIENRMFFRTMFFTNGLLQSTGWPVLVAVMGNWFNKSSSGLVFGIWSSNANVGNIHDHYSMFSVHFFSFRLKYTQYLNLG